jgi:hypothetical protein
MTRTNRIAILAALTILVAAAGTALATRAPGQAEQRSGFQAEESEAPEAAEALDAEAIAHAVARLEERLIDVGDVGAFEALAERYGLGGAVRLHAWSSQTDMSVDDLAARRDGDGTTPVGWGRLAKDLGAELGIDLKPGLGWIMGNGRGAGDPPGQERSSGD